MFLIEVVKNIIFDIKKIYVLKRIKWVDIENILLLSFDCKELKTKEIAYQNDVYGIATVIKQYAKLNSECVFNFTIEHGIYLLENFVFPPDVIYNTSVVCMGDYRKKILNKIGKDAITIGPYIAYAKDYYSKKRFEKAKHKYGKTLLVFPTHSSSKLSLKYIVQDFINEIESIKDRYNTVMVCLYWLDIKKDIVKQYKDKGYTLVCAGYGNDKYFLNRLKTIIKLSDAVIFNDVGTGLGYAVYLNKPCYIFKQQIEKVNIESAPEQEGKFGKEYYKLLNIFGDKNFVLTKEQIELCNFIYGLDRVKSEVKLKNILKLKVK